MAFFGTGVVELGIRVDVNVHHEFPGGWEKLIHPFDPTQNWEYI